MILLTMLAVGLLSLAAIELRTSSMGMHQSVARSNARLALMIAIGELQKSAGPDQRISARADILDDTDPSKSKWTGIWNTEDPAPSEPIWLVSGTDPGNKGAAPGPNEISSQLATKLVSAADGQATEPGDEIIVPIQMVRDTTDGATASGGFGWWVGDEGVKARLNLGDPRFDDGSAEARLARAATPAATPINQLSSFDQVEVGTELNETITKALTSQQMHLVSSSIQRESVAKHFHDLGTRSRGVLANIREGGLKRDLSRALHDTPSPVSGRIFEDAAGTGPDWDIARSWASLAVDVSGGFPTAPVIRPHRETADGLGPAQHGVGPLLSRFGFEWWTRIERLSGQPGATDSSYTLGVGLRPVLQITNPYNVKLPSRAYRLSFNFCHDGAGGLRWLIGGREMEFTWATLCGISGSSPLLNGLGSKNHARPWFHFNTPVVEIQPGQTLLFMPDTDNWEASMSATEFIPLALGENSGGGVLRFPVDPSPDRTVTWTELRDANAFRFGENQGARWSDPGSSSRNFVMQLHLHDAGQTPHTLLNGMSEPLSRIERISSRKFDQSWWLHLAKQWARSGDEEGRRFQVFDHFLGNERFHSTPQYDRNYSWLRDFNPRFHFPCARNGRPLVDGAEDGDPKRSVLAWGRSNGHSGYQSAIDPAETPEFNGSVYWGNAKAPPLGQARIVLFDLPTGDVLSPGQLQHVNLGGRDRPLRPDNRIGERVRNDKPAQAGCIQSPYLIGNSYRDPAVAIGETDLDWSYCANREIWDRWFVSGLSPALNEDDWMDGRLPNPRMEPTGSDNPSLATAMNIDKAAGTLLVKGMFNLNSTSVEAWKAILGSTANGSSVVALPGEDAIGFDPPDGNDKEPRYGRTLVCNQTKGGSDMLVGGDGRWSGPVGLTEAQLDDLARGIVQRIKLRANEGKRPIASLSEFVNRTAETECGLIQETFDQSALPDGSALQGARLNRDFLGNFASGGIEPEGAPGALRQGDFLQSVGSFVNVRSDTFRIRAYGECRSGSEVTARAWCEAIVQRTPEFVDPADAPETELAELTRVSNKRFGRRFILESFRWLNPSEL